MAGHSSKPLSLSDRMSSTLGGLILLRVQLGSERGILGGRESETRSGLSDDGLLETCGGLLRDVDLLGLGVEDSDWNDSNEFSESEIGIGESEDGLNSNFGTINSDDDVEGGVESIFGALLTVASSGGMSLTALRFTGVDFPTLATSVDSILLINGVGCESFDVECESLDIGYVS